MRKMLILGLTIALVLSSGVLVPAVKSQDNTYSVALITAQGGLGDRSYNDLAYIGLTKAAAELDVKAVPIESADPVGEAETLLRSAAEARFDLVITAEYSHFETLGRIAPDYPDTTFAIVNVVVDQPNVVSIMFDEHTGSFLAGALAGLVTTDTTLEQINPEAVIGVIGGVKSSGIDVFLYGYLQGACAVNPDVDVLMAYANDFGDPAKGREMALAMHEQGADVVFQVAGGTGAGIIQAAKDENFFAIGVDSDQDYLAPGNVLTSMLKRVDTAVFDTIRMGVEGQLQGGTELHYGLDVGGVGLSDMVYTRQLIPHDYMNQVNSFKQQILDGTLKVIDIRTLDADTFGIVDNNPTCAGVEALKAALAE
jgi:basic membrane protein A